MPGVLNGQAHGAPLIVGARQGRIVQELQPETEQTRTEISDALKAAEKVLTPEQWKQVPDQVRNPFQQRRQRRG